MYDMTRLREYKNFLKTKDMAWPKLTNKILKNIYTWVCVLYINRYMLNICEDKLTFLINV